MAEFSHNISIHTIWSNLDSDEINWLIERMDEDDWLDGVRDRAYDNGFEQGRLEGPQKSQTNNDEDVEETELETLIDTLLNYDDMQIAALPEEVFEEFEKQFGLALQTKQNTSPSKPNTSLLDEVKLLSTLVSEAHPNDSIITELKLLIQNL